MVEIGYHFHFNPREIDEFNLTEFDVFARMCDEIRQQNEKARRESERSAARRRR